MPTTPTYPGVYLEELASAVRPITAVSTSVTAFVGATKRGPAEQPVTLTSFADFERRFGGLSPASPLSYAVHQFFLNGGTTAVVVRLTGAGSGQATTTLNAGSSAALDVTARDPGTGGNDLVAAVEAGAAAGTFGLTVRNLVSGALESYPELSLDPTSAQFADTVVNGSSALVTVAGRGSTVPDPSGTTSAELSDPLPALTGDLGVDVGGQEYTLALVASGETAPTTVEGLALLLERRLRALQPYSAALAGARVRAVGRRLQVVPGAETSTVTFTGTVATALGLTAGARPSSVRLAGGSAGGALTAADFIGSADAKTGINALRDVDDVNLLCLPEVADLALDTMVAILAEAERLCLDKRMFLIVDPPASWTSLDAARAQLVDLDAVRSDHAAVYFPRLRMLDPLSNRLRDFPPCGAVAGVMAATDTARGVWKAPAGTDTRLSGVRALTVPLTDPENGLLNPLGVNCLRSFPVIGPVVWGARTLAGADTIGSPWKYVPVRRLALMLEESLFRGTKWVVFEPNDEPLWAQIRLNVGAFMQTLFRQGAFQGTSARDAYFVKCDRDTTTQDDINHGVVNIVVGFAPLKPAEFVVVKIQQLSGQLEN